MTTLTAPTKTITLQGLAPDVFQSCVLNPPAPPAPVDDEIFVPVAPGITPETLPPVPTIINTAPDQVIGCINDASTNAQERLNALFPAAISGDGVIERLTNDFWVFDGTVWNNVGPTPGPTLVVEALVPVWNEIALLNAVTRTGITALSLDYPLELETVVDPLIVTTRCTIERIIKVAVPSASIELAPAGATVVGGASVKPPAGEVALAGTGGAIATGASIKPPAGVVAVAGAPGPTVPRIVVPVFIPAANVLLAAERPVIRTGNAIDIPAAQITAEGVSPSYVGKQVSYFRSLAAQVYSWQRDFMVDWWGD